MESEDMPVSDILRDHEIITRLDALVTRIESLERKLDTAFKGWNSVLERADMHMNRLFNGKVPPYILRTIIKGAFKDDGDAKP